MPTRATRSHVHKPSPASTSSAPSKPVATTRPRSKSVSKVSAPAPVSKKKSGRGKARDVWCVCRGPDDSTPMIRCECCKDWFHFACINLSERDAEEIQLYVCDACHSKTGQSIVYDWEGPDAVEEFVDHVAKPKASPGTNGAPSVNDPGTKMEDTGTAMEDTGTAVDDTGTAMEDTGTGVEDDLAEEEDAVEEEASGDDYEEETHDSAVVRRGRGTKRITSSDEENVHDGNGSDSPPPTSRRAQLKRKRGKETHSQRKRPRKPSSELTDDDRDQDGRNRKGNIKAKTKRDAVLDPTRKYCLGKLRDVLLPIFVQFSNPPQTADGNPPEGRSSVEHDEERNKNAEEQGTSFVQELEQCLFELYGEPDKHGQKTAAGKYKDRFRMLSFNLSQPDRHLLRRNIGTGSLSALQLSKMSSIDLANEQTKQQVEAANRESLEHSILIQRPIAARAKITHKGEEVIEDLVGDDIGRRIRDEEQREKEREREREKGAREKAKMLPPSPVVPKEPSFKGPQDILAQQHNAASQKAAQVQAQAHHMSLPASSSVAEAPPEPAFKFDDLIAIDLPDESPPQDNTAPDSHAKTETVVAPTESVDVKSDERAPATSSEPERFSPTTPSASFDLDNVWSGNVMENTPQDSSRSPITSAPADEARESPNIDIDLGTAADDEDFDMFLDKPDTTGSALPISGHEAERATFEGLPIIWSGHLHLPDAGKSPAVHARQVGGRHIEPGSPQWHILFPPHLSHQLKVDGRVPVKESAKYMTQSRMNITRELIIVALTPSADRTDYDEILSFLVKRDRHAVVHPWGPNPSPDAPGKELYLIPIMPHEALPDYVEILDLVNFPKHREEKLLLGVFILTKGKFSERVLPSSLQSPGTLPVLRPNVPPAPHVLPVPSTSSATPSTPLAAQALPSTSSIPPEIVSKLTAEQIESLLQTVLSGSLSSAPMATPQQAVSQPPTTYPPVFPPALANLLPQFPPNPFPPYAAAAQGSPQFPPPASPQTQHSPAVPYDYSHMSASPPRDNDYRGPSSYAGGGYGRSGRGDFERPRGRGGGRNFGGSDRGRGGRGSDFDRPRDAGWGTRGRGRGFQSQSPPRHW